MASKHRVTVGEELRYDSDLQGLKNLSGTYVPAVVVSPAPAGDATAALHVARDTAGVGGSVYVGAGTYTASALVLNKANQRWTLHPSAVIKLADGQSTHLVNMQASGVTVVGGTLDGNRANQSGGFQNCMQISADDCTVSEVAIKNAANHGVHTRNVSRTLVTRCKISATSGDGIYFEVDSTATADAYDNKAAFNTVDRSAEAAGAVIEGCVKAHGNPTSGKRPYRTQIIGNHCLMPSMTGGSLGADGSAICIEVMYGADGAVVADNTTSGGIMGISISGFDPIGGSAKVSVTGNTVTGPAYYGIEWANAKRGTCQGNTIDGAGLALVGVVQSQATSSYCTIVGNNITGCTQDGIAVNAPHTSISANVITVPSGARYGIDVAAGTSNVSITGNTIDSSASTGYGIATFNACNYLTIVGNALMGNDVALKGIACDRPPLGLTIIGNTIHNFTQHGILVYGTTGVTVDSAAVIGNTYRSVAVTFATQFSGGAAWGTRVLLMDSESGLTIKQGGIALPGTTKTASYTATVNDSVVFANGAGITITLPSAVTAGMGRMYVVKNTGASSVTIGATAGSVDATTVAAGAAARYISDSVNWWSI